MFHLLYCLILSYLIQHIAVVCAQQQQVRDNVSLLLLLLVVVVVVRRPSYLLRPLRPSFYPYRFE